MGYAAQRRHLADGKIWGGEVLVADFRGFERRAHFRYVPLAGGDTAVREPWRIGLSYLLDTFGARVESLDLPLWRRIAPKKLAAVRSMIERGINSVETRHAAGHRGDRAGCAGGASGWVYLGGVSQHSGGDCGGSLPQVAGEGGHRACA